MSFENNNMVPIEVLVFIASILIFFYFRRPKNLPPGPVNWFGIGGLLAVKNADGEYPHVAFAKLAKKYGDIMFIQLGANPTVMISKFEDMKVLFTKEEFQARYQFSFAKERAFDKELGLLTSSHEIWRGVRTFSSKRLRDDGFRKSDVLEGVIERELKTFLPALGKKAAENSGILHFESNFTISIINVIWNVLFGFESKDCEHLLGRFQKSCDDIVAVVAYDNLNIIFPFLRTLAPEWSGHNRAKELYKEQQDIMRELVAESKKRHTENEDAYNFVQAFQQEVDKNKGNSETLFTEEQMVITLLDLFLAGSETTSHFLGFVVLYLVLHPEMQKKMQQEMSELVGHDGVIFLGQAEKLPYTQAFMFEIFRHCNIAPIPLARKAVVDYKYKGYTIPKDTCVLYNLYCVFSDPEYWGDPEIFRPERFLVPSTGKLTKTERMAYFGFGKRICLGDVLAKQMAFAYITGLLNRFTFQQVPGQNPPSEISISSFTSRPRPFQVLITPNRK